MVVENVLGREKLVIFMVSRGDLNEAVTYLNGRRFVRLAIITLNNLDLAVLAIGEVIGIDYGGQ